MAGVGEIRGVVARRTDSVHEIVFRPSVIEHMHQHRQTRWWKREAGGQLFAELNDTKLDVVLATGPYHKDFRSRFGYRSAPDCAQREIWKQRECGLYYCGDWHTHPQRFPKASDEDFMTIEKLQARSDLRLGAVLMVILGTAQDEQGIAVYVRTAEGTLQWTTSSLS